MCVIGPQGVFTTTIENVHGKYWSGIIIWDGGITNDEISFSKARHTAKEDAEAHSRVASYRRRTLERDDEADE